MGFPTDENGFGTDCPVGCWPAGQTPEWIYVSFGGLKTGDDWSPSDRFPPNSFIPLLQNSSTTWQRSLFPYLFSLELNAGYTELDIGFAGYGSVFYAKPLTSCIWQFVNELTTPVNNKFYDGKAQLGWAPPVSGPSVKRLMALLDYPPDKDTYAQFWGAGPDKMIQLLAGKPGDTNLLILFDYTA